jgi:hypothetical protein
MADTQRTIAALQTLFADQAAQGISPQDLRDFLVSAEPDRGELWFSTPAATTTSDTGTYYKAAGTTTLQTSPAAVNFDMPANNRLRYTGTPTRQFLVQANASQTTASGSVVIHYRLAVDGTTVASSEIQRKQGTTPSDVGAFSIGTIVTLANGSYVELWLRNATSTTTVTVEAGNLLVWGGLD